MKNSITTLLFLIVFQFVAAQQSSQKIEMNIDALGNADIKISMKMTAQQWQMWNADLGGNPAALKRDIERSMPGFFLDDFKLDKQDMKRSFELNLKAYGICKIDKRGQWSLETDEKNANLTELSLRSYMLVSSPVEFGGSLQQTIVVNFPEEASAIKVDKDSYGKTIFEFDMKTPSTGTNALNWVGLLFILGGISVGGYKLSNTNNKK